MICSAFQTQNQNFLIRIIHNHLHPKIDKPSKQRSLKFSSIVKYSSYRNTGQLIEPIMAKINDAVMLTSGASGRINALLSLHALRSLFRLICAFFMILLLPFRGRRRIVISAAESLEKGGKEEGLKLTSSSGKVVKVPAAMVPRKSVADKDVAARRTLAIKRVVEDSGDKDTVREFSLFSTSRGDTIFTQSWTPVKVQVRGLVVILHGLNEHSGRYSDFAKKLNANGFKVYGMDWIGHEYVSIQKPLA